MAEAKQDILKEYDDIQFDDSSNIFGVVVNTIRSVFPNAVDTSKSVSPNSNKNTYNLKAIIIFFFVLLQKQEQFPNGQNRESLAEWFIDGIIHYSKIYNDIEKQTIDSCKTLQGNNLQNNPLQNAFSSLAFLFEQCEKFCKADTSVWTPENKQTIAQFILIFSEKFIQEYGPEQFTASKMDEAFLFCLEKCFDESDNTSSNFSGIFNTLIKTLLSWFQKNSIANALEYPLIKNIFGGLFQRAAWQSKNPALQKEKYLSLILAYTEILNYQIEYNIKNPKSATRFSSDLPIKSALNSFFKLHTEQAPDNRLNDIFYRPVINCILALEKLGPAGIIDPDKSLATYIADFKPNNQHDEILLSDEKNIAHQFIIETCVYLKVNPVKAGQIIDNYLFKWVSEHEKINSLKTLVDVIANAKFIANSTTIALLHAPHQQNIPGLSSPTDLNTYFELTVKKIFLWRCFKKIDETLKAKQNAAASNTENASSNPNINIADETLASFFNDQKEFLGLLSDLKNCHKVPAIFGASCQTLGENTKNLSDWILKDYSQYKTIFPYFTVPGKPADPNYSDPKYIGIRWLKCAIKMGSTEAAEQYVEAYDKGVVHRPEQHPLFSFVAPIASITSKFSLFSKLPSLPHLPEYDNTPQSRIREFIKEIYEAIASNNQQATEAWMAGLLYSVSSEYFKGITSATVIIESEFEMQLRGILSTHLFLHAQNLSDSTKNSLQKGLSAMLSYYKEHYTPEKFAGDLKLAWETIQSQVSSKNSKDSKVIEAEFNRLKGIAGTGNQAAAATENSAAQAASPNNSNG
jgi:hypothetical protein